MSVTFTRLATYSAMEHWNERDKSWAMLMRASNAGDAAAYKQLLEGLVPFLRVIIQRGAQRVGAGSADVEDVVQEVLLAVHLKRHTWRDSEPLTPWIRAIARNKLVDSLRRRGRSAGTLPIEAVSETLAAPEQERLLSAAETSKILGMIKGRSRQVVEAIAVQGLTIRECAERLSLREGAVRVALHRGLSALARTLRDREK